MNQNSFDNIDDLLRKPYWIIDILPKQVPSNSEGQYFAIEQYFLNGERAEIIKRKQLNVILKVNCYKDIVVDGLGKNPIPEELTKVMMDHETRILIHDALLVTEPADTYLTIYNPDEQLLDLITKVASSEGLFTWKGNKG